jgi:hypothetical protein
MRNARRTPAVSVQLLAACVVIMTVVVAEAGGRWIGTAEVGFDSYIERYSIAEADTLSSVNEAFTRLRLGYASGSLMGNYALIETRQLVGESSYETALRGQLTRRLGRQRAWTVNLDADVAHRGFREGSVYDFTDNYTRTTGRAALRARARPWLTIRLDDRIEWLDYSHRTEFDYDFTRNSGAAVLDFDRDPLRGFSVGTRYTTMSVPDSSQIEYHAVTPFVETRVFGGPHRRVYAGGGVERRVYPTDGTRSSFHGVLASGLVEFPVHPSWSVELSSDLERYSYDTVTDAYPDYLELRSYALVGWNRGGLRIGAGPALAWLSSDGAPEDEYREIGVRLALELLGTRGLFVSASYEPGARDYTAYDSSLGTLENAEAIFSDYGYHRVSVFANSRLRGPLWLNVFIDYQPEDHDRTGDDATATVASAALMLTF